MKNFAFIICLLVFGTTAKAQSGKVVVYIPKTNVCYEASEVGTSTNGTTLTLKMADAVLVETTEERTKLANDCTKGEFTNDNSNGGTHNIECDESVATTCFCTGVK